MSKKLKTSSSTAPWCWNWYASFSDMNLCCLSIPGSSPGSSAIIAGVRALLSRFAWEGLAAETFRVKSACHLTCYFTKPAFCLGLVFRWLLVTTSCFSLKAALSHFQLPSVASTSIRAVLKWFTFAPHNYWANVQALILSSWVMIDHCKQVPLSSAAGELEMKKETDYLPFTATFSKSENPQWYLMHMSSSPSPAKPAITMETLSLVWPNMISQWSFFLSWKGRERLVGKLTLAWFIW